VNDKLLQEAREKYPEAENDVVAVDLFAQDIYKGAVDASGNEAQYNILCSKYHALQALRAELLDRDIAEQSGIVKKEVVNG
jgi:hypothetical protein